MYSAHQITREFEAALCEYTGAKYAVAVNSCTMALLLACAWWNYGDKPMTTTEILARDGIEIPKRTYVGVPMSIKHAGYAVRFRDEDWSGMYQLKPLPVWDSARWFTYGIYHSRIWREAPMLCVSFHWAKTLGIQQGGAILHDDPQADEWLRRARFDGRKEGVAPKDDTFPIVGWHCYMSPEVAAEGLMRLSLLPKHNDPLPNDDYPDLSKLEIFQ
jgi:dTDP-4-amino-4,6-dideoxygalactose transaminase